MTDKAVTAFPLVTPTSDDSVLGAQNGMVKRFAAPPTFGQLSAATGAGLVGFDASETYASGTVGAKISDLLAQISTGENIIKNSRFQVCSGLSIVTKMNYQSTGTHGVISVTSYTTGANTVTLNTADTGQLKAGDLVSISGGTANSASLKLAALRVLSVVANTSFDVRLPLGLTLSVSEAVSATPRTVGDYTGSTGSGPDGWNKTTATDLWIEDGTVNLLTGTSRVVGLRKDGAGQEVCRAVFSANDCVRFRGQRLSYGMWVYHKTKGGSGTFRLFINNGAMNYSASGASAGGWEWLSLEDVAGPTASTLEIGISLDGSANDVYFVGKPHALVGSAIAHQHYAQPESELLIPLVKISPATWINAAITFPAADDGVADSYSFQFDPYAESNGTIAPDVRAFDALVEGINANAVVTGSANVRAIVFRDQVTAPVRYGPLAAQYVQNVKSFAAAPVILDSNGRALVYSAVASDSWSNVSIDINRFQLS